MDGRFFTNCLRNIIEKAVSICLIIPQNRKVKNIQLRIIDQSFELNGMGISYQKKLESLEEKKEEHPSCKHGVRRICQLYTKGGSAGKLTWCEHLKTTWIIVDETTYKDPAPKTLDELRQWLRLAWKNVTLDTLCMGTRTFYTSPLRKWQKTYRKTFWLLIFYVLNVKWIMNDILTFTKRFC